ncbi:thermonuclease family protein [Phormidesmis sp. 146-12]
MGFLIIKGVFNPKSGFPDGDSVRFLADDDTLFDQLEGQVDIKPGGEVQLRYEAIDALEKAAKKPFSSDATEANIELLGGNKNGLPGYILSSHTDKNGRPVCFVFTGNSPNADGTDILLEGDLLKQSINYQLLIEGLVYPMFYETLYKELRDEMTEAVKVARQADKGIWAKDASTKGVTIKPPVNLAELPPIFPKLWRRLESFYGRPSNKTKTVRQFVESLARGSDRLFTVPDQRSIKFSTAMSVSGDKLKLQYKPEELIFRE